MQLPYASKDRCEGIANRLSGLNPNQFGLHTTCRLRPSRPRHHVQFAAHTELWQVDAWLHGEAGMGQNEPFIVRLQVVEISPFPCRAAAILCPVRWVKYFPKPALQITLRAASSACHPAIGHPSANARCTGLRLHPAQCAQSRRRVARARWAHALPCRSR